jgi:hypothetical protein
MTQTVERRPLTRSQPPRPTAASVVVPGVVAAMWALGAGLVAVAVPVLLAWVSDARSGAGAAEATRTAGQLWLLAHRGSLELPGGALGLTPLGLMAVPLALLHRAGRHGARTVAPPGPRQAATLVLATAFPYAVGAAFLSAVLGTSAVRPDPVSALLGGFVVGLVGVGSGVAREAKLYLLLRRLPARVRRIAVAAAGGSAALLAGGALVACGSLLAHAGRVGSLAGATAPGWVGGVTLLLLCMLLIPNAAVWGAAFALGPGFAVGVGTSVGPLAVTLGPVPALPLFAALPGGDVPTWVLICALLLPLLSGVVVGLLLARRCAGSIGTAACEAAVAGVTAGLGMAVLAWLSGGPLGGGRLVDVGPSPWQTGLAAAVELAVPAAGVAALAVRRKRRSLG